MQASPSSQLYAVPLQAPAVHLSLLVQALPSLQLAPLALLLQAAVACAGLQTRQAFVGLLAPLA